MTKNNIWFNISFATIVFSIRVVSDILSILSVHFKNIYKKKIKLNLWLIKSDKNIFIWTFYFLLIYVPFFLNKKQKQENN